MKRHVAMLLTLFLSAASGQEQPSSIVIDGVMHHIRNTSDIEWSNFPQHAEADKYHVTFQGKANPDEHTLRLIQEDIKQLWHIKLNNQELGQLHRDENSLIGFWRIPKETITDGTNTLTISTTSKNTDDIRTGKAVIHPYPLDTVTQAGKVTVHVRDETTQKPVPCRITIIGTDGLLTIGTESTDEMAIRPGVIYCKGSAEFHLPAGAIRIVAGRGPEYSIASRNITVKPGDTHKIDLTIRREVNTDGMVACDTHVHTLTHSGHGDSSVRERMLTLAGEAIEFPIATDHNKHIDYEDLAVELGVRTFFTPVIGNEVTTKLGHFNIFPVASAATTVPNHKAESWDEIFESIYSTNHVKVAILNHARDIHSNYRPFGPRHHLAVTGQNLDGWKLQANAMEIINSAAQQTDMMRLVHDWMGLLNAGKNITPVGCSDSHDVARHFVGQARTYIRCDDSDPGSIDIDTATTNFVAGKVSVSCGLISNAVVNNDYSSGDLAPQSNQYQLRVTVMGASWIKAQKVEIFLNGTSFRTVPFLPKNQSKPGIKSTVVLQLPVSNVQDIFVTTVARGPGVTELYWPIAKPYQQTSPDWTPQCMAVTGAIRIDADGDGQFTSAREYAQRLRESSSGLPEFVTQLKNYDKAVALHAAAIVMDEAQNQYIGTFLQLARDTSVTIGDAFERYYADWQTSQRVRAGGE